MMKMGQVCLGCRSYLLVQCINRIRAFINNSLRHYSESVFFVNLHVAAIPSAAAAALAETYSQASVDAFSHLSCKAAR